MVEKEKMLRPKIPAGLVKQIKAKYPETLTMDNTATVIWALERFLSFEECVNRGDQ